MMTLSKRNGETFDTCLEAFYQERAVEGDPLLKARAKAWDHFQEIGLPTRKTEVFQYVKLRRLFSKTLCSSVKAQISQEQVTPYIFPESQGAALVFINGHFDAEFSQTENLPKRLVVTSLNKATRTYGSFLNNYWARSLKEETDSFAVLNAALHQDGAFIYIPPKTVVETPIQVLNIIDTAGSHMMIQPRFHAYVGNQSEVQFAFTQKVLSGDHFFVNQVEEFVIEDDAHVRCTQDACDQAPGVWHFDAFRATLKRNSTLNVVEATKGGTTVRHDYRVALTGENGEALLNGVWMLDDKNEAHVNVLIDHQAPHCHSYQLFKGLLNDNGRSSFEGKIVIRQAAQKTDAYQLNNNMILSDGAKADSKPNLEIFADDVKASHGSTIGQINPKHLIYLRTRGIPEDQAEALLAYGFCEEVIEKVKIPSLLNKMHKLARNFLMEW